MSDAACAEEEIDRIHTESGTLSNTIDRIVAGDLVLRAGAIEQARASLYRALKELRDADRIICDNIESCAGCPT